MVGDGSIPPPRAYRAPLALAKPRHAAPGVRRPDPKPFQNPFVVFSYPDVVLILISNGIFNSVYYGVTATISSLFARNYPYLSETDLGLCYIPIGGGMVVGTIINGTQLASDPSCWLTA
jgi:predicted MFS family arabinose efflux permease